MSSTPADRRMRFTTVPVSLTPFVGRAREVADVRALLLCPDVRLLTLTGPGGVGKTRLAMRLVDEAGDAFGGRVTFVPLASIHDPELVVPTIAHAFDLRDEGGPPLFDRLVAVIRLRPLLLVLDNVEQVVEAGGAVRDLLVACPELTVLATSRVPLRIDGEQEYPIPPLAVPDEHGAAYDEAMTSDAVTLFVQRARAVRPDFQLTSDNVAIVAAICGRLDGLPLAIELAAVRSRLLSPRALLTRLDPRLPLLTSGPRNAPERHQTMRNAIAWSDSLLTPASQQLFRELSVFVGGWSLDAAEAVISPDLLDELDGGVLGGLAVLAEQSLITQVEQPDGEPRFQMLETIREYAFTELSAGDMLDVTRLRHAEWCRELALTHWRAFFGTSQRASTLILIREIDNLRAALSWTLTQPVITRATEIVGGLAVFWYFYGNWSEGLAWMDRARPGLDALDDTTRSRVLAQYALLFAQARSDLVSASAMCHEAIALARIASDIDLLTRCYQILGAIAMGVGDHANAEINYRLALDLQRRHDNAPMTGMSRPLLARLAYERGDHDAATALLEEALADDRDTHNPIGTCWSLSLLARITREHGEFARAAGLYVQSLDLRWELGDRVGCLVCLRGLADVAVSTGNHDAAARFLAAVEAIGESLGLTLSGARRDRFVDMIEQTRNAMAPDAFGAVWHEGRQMTIPSALTAGQAFASSLDQASQVTAEARSGTARISTLSPRETDVLRLIAAGLSTAQIAEQLFLSPRTVTTHLTSIYNKLGFNTRVAAARFAADNGLV